MMMNQFNDVDFENFGQRYFRIVGSVWGITVFKGLYTKFLLQIKQGEFRTNGSQEPNIFIKKGQNGSQEPNFFTQNSQNYLFGSGSQEPNYRTCCHSVTVSNYYTIN